MIIKIISMFWLIIPISLILLMIWVIYLEFNYFFKKIINKFKSIMGYKK